MIRKNHSGCSGAKDDKENVFEKNFVQECIREVPRNLENYYLLDYTACTLKLLFTSMKNE